MARRSAITPRCIARACGFAVEQTPVTLLQSLPTAASDWPRIHFHFFPDEELRNLHMHWQDLTIRSDAPEIVEVPNGIIPKLTLPFITQNNRVVCVYDHEHRPVEASARLRSPGKRSMPDLGPAELCEVRRDDRSAYFLGINARHYGHFLLETLSRAWAWTEHGGDHVAVIMSPPIRDFVRPFLELIPGLADRVEVLEAPTQFDTVTVAAPAFSIGREAHAVFKALCERMAKRVLPSSAAETTEQPVYLSRSGLYTTAKRFLVGEDRLERFLKREGFRVAHPETMSVAEQIAMFNTHKWFVGPIGSACHSRLFSRRPINLVVLCQHLVAPHNRPSDKANFILCDLLSEGTAHYANVLSLPDIGANFGQKASFPVLLEEERLLSLLREMGLIRAHAAPAGQPPDLVEYKRKWVDFARLSIEKKKNEKLSEAIAALEATLPRQSAARRAKSAIRVWVRAFRRFRAKLVRNRVPRGPQ